MKRDARSLSSRAQQAVRECAVRGMLVGLTQAAAAVQFGVSRQQAKAEKAEIHWGDELGLRSDHQADTRYGRKEQTPVIPGTDQRRRCNMISTITGHGTLRFMVFKQRFTSAVFIKFLGRLVHSAGRKVYLIVDGHPLHKSRAVQRWLAARPETIRMILLPAYSPDLNPDEFLNHDVKQNAVGRRRGVSIDRNWHRYARAARRAFCARR